MAASRSLFAAAVALVLVIGLGGGSARSAQESECVKCHTNPAKLAEIAKELAKIRPTEDQLKSLTQGPGMGGQVEPMAAEKKMLIGQDMFQDQNHTDLSCVDCHQGNPEDSNWRTVHRGVDRDPSFPAPGICAECHEEQAKNYQKSLHYSVRPMRLAVQARCNPALWAKVEPGFDYHCASCHSSCGHCHLSRPANVGGGLLAGHAYVKKPPQEKTCLACHGTRAGDEFLGQAKGLKPDVHLAQADMGCQDCHTAAQMHGDGQEYDSRYQVKGGPACLDCHDELYAEGAENRSIHQDHKGKLSCQVCHAQAYANCAGCHLSETKQGRRAYELAGHGLNFKIGLNPRQSEKRPERFVTVRQTPASPETFDFYAKDALTGFDKAPTWTLATPHNIQRKTEQNSACNNCHSKPGLYLKDRDIEPALRQANHKVVVPLKMIPPKIAAPAGETAEKK